jgi:hypothetical protein
MALGAGFQDAQGQWIFGELDDAGGLASDLLNLAQTRLSTGLAADRARLAILENDTGWISPTLNAGWTSANETVRYRRKAGVIFFSGRANSTGANATIFNLPLGFRPDYLMVLLAERGGAALRFQITPAGDVTVLAAGAINSISIASLPSFIAAN